MRRSTERILTTHTGSLPRPAAVVEQLLAGKRSGPALDAAVDAAVADVIANKRPRASTSSTTASKAAPTTPST